MKNFECYKQNILQIDNNIVTLSQSKYSTPQSKIEILEQFQFTQTETLNFLNILESEEEIEFSKQKQIKTQLFHRRASIQSSQQSSIQSNDYQVDQINIKQADQQIQQNKQLVTQQLKRSIKRSQTAFKKDFGQFQKQHGAKLFVKRPNQAIVNNFEQIRKQKSIITYNINQIGKQHLRTIQVKYFRTNLSKVLFIEKDMTAIEFIVLALKEYSLERRFDQNLYEYKNYTLAYQLETLEDQMEMDEDRFRKPIQRTKSFNEKDEDNIAARRVSCDERAITSQVEYSFQDIEDKTITIDYPATLSCKQVDIVVNSTCELSFGIDLLTIKKTYELFPQYIILLIEDAQTQSNQQIKCLNTSTIQNVFEQLNSGPINKRSLKDYFLRLKYSCIHTNILLLCLNTPINELPIHWLVLEKKYNIETQPSELIDISNKFSNFKQQNYVDDGLLSFNPLDSTFKIDSKNYLSQIYSYQDFSLMQLKKKQQFQVILGIDYFDIQIIKVNQQNNQFSPISIFQYIKNYMIEMFNNQKKLNKTIKLKSIKKYYLDVKQNTFYFIYKNSVRNFKQLCFFPLQSNDKRTQAKFNEQFFDIYQKFGKLLEIRKKSFRDK
ncbi:unnamed protein product [Paramecium sonneborni]|uniref:Uncharacterized protein n=1 Tax=Paramecium sonneborni TaxID=65129 RepID=A0A8S1RQW2_9CILI|nr:unnamed protein product [Paramecium sonneborni]